MISATSGGMTVEIRNPSWRASTGRRTPAPDAAAEDFRGDPTNGAWSRALRNGWRLGRWRRLRDRGLWRYRRRHGLGWRRRLGFGRQRRSRRSCDSGVGPSVGHVTREPGPTGSSTEAKVNSRRVDEFDAGDGRSGCSWWLRALRSGRRRRCVDDEDRRIVGEVFEGRDGGSDPSRECPRSHRYRGTGDGRVTSASGLPYYAPVRSARRRVHGACSGHRRARSLWARSPRADRPLR